MIQKREFIVYLLLSLVTCGIYGIYVWYTMTEDMNKMFEGDGHESPNYIVVVLLSIVTCGIYSYVWMYNVGERIQNSGRSMYNVEIKESGSTILLWMIIGTALAVVGTYIAHYFVMNNFNICADEYNRVHGYNS